MLKHTLFLYLASFYLLKHCAMISCAKVEPPHIKLYSEHRLHPLGVLWKNPIIRLKVRETLQWSNQRHTLYRASVQCRPEMGSSAAIFRSQFEDYYHWGSVVYFLCCKLNWNLLWHLCWGFNRRPLEHLQRSNSEISLSWWLNGSYRHFLHFFIFPFQPHDSATLAPFLTTPTISILQRKNPISYFTTLICSPREGCYVFLLNIYTSSIVLWQENANLRGTQKIAFIQ